MFFHRRRDCKLFRGILWPPAELLKMGAQQSAPAPPTMSAEEVATLTAECEKRFEKYMACVERHQQGAIKGLRLDDCEEESVAYRECQKRMPKRQR
jgi:hypothetical protein